MDKKTVNAFLDDVAPGWADADNPAQFVKTIDPKHRQQAARAVWWLAQNPITTPSKKARKAAKEG